jgi:hypothetical protein
LATAAAGTQLGACIRIARPSLRDGWIPALVFGAELGLMIWLGGLYVLGWDALVTWEFKARAAALNSGSMPLAYYMEMGARWSHPEYPLLLPLAEAWLFDWAGLADEGLVRWLFYLYDAALLAGMYVLGTRLSGSKWNGILAMLLLFLVPQLIISDGAGTTGWADYVVALGYAMAAGYLVLAFERRTSESFGLVGVLCAALVWTKQEGAFLWVCLVLATVVFAQANHRKQATALVAVPALVVLVAWRIFLQALGVPGSPDYLPVNPSTFWTHVNRLPELLGWTAGQMRALGVWGLLWPALAFSTILPARGRLRQHLVLTVLVIAPLVPDVMVFVFSAWTPYLSHVESALPRLMEQVAPLAVLAIATAAPTPALQGRLLARVWGFPGRSG